MTGRRSRPVIVYEPAGDPDRESDRLNAALQLAVHYLVTDDRRGNRQPDGRVNWRGLHDPRPIKCPTGGNGTTQRPPWRLLTAFTPESRQRSEQLIGAAGLADGLRRYGAEAHQTPRNKTTAIGTALLMDDPAILDALGETETSALDIWAAKLLGFTKGQQDSDDGHRNTRSLIRDHRNLGQTPPR